MNRAIQIVVLGLLSGGFAAGGPISGNTVGLQSPTSTISFSEVALPNETQVTSQFAAYGASFSPGMFLYTPQPFAPPNFSGVGLAGFRYSGYCCTQAFSIFFTRPVTGAAFAAVSANRSATFTALLNGQVTESFTATVPLSSSANFFGFDGIALDRIDVQLGDPVNGGIGIDTLQLGQPSVPEPDTLFIVLVPLGTIFLRIMFKPTLAKHRP